ncbi:MAG: sulfite exporter TauE/SafE family protein [Ectothiorhodospiraceae bacterium]|nr:sulfite exporter TauE/SafE family protein [Chromatiales bacterium]MCP5153687.1 sulfite exporter TauE/SafE family protein [Ectothiorhodospiraceae bacterium]
MTDVVLAIGALLAGLTVGLAGFGDALVLTAVGLQVLAPQALTPLVVALGVPLYLMSSWRLRGALRARRLAPLTVAGIAGIPAGLWLLERADPEPVRLAVGLLLTVHATRGLARLRAHRASEATTGGTVAVGAAGGVLGGLAGLSGVLVAAWCAQRPWSPDEQRAVYQPYVLVMHAAALAGCATAGLLDSDVGRRVVLALPAAGAGLWLGLRLYDRVDAVGFRRVVLSLLLASGLVLLARTMV